MSTKSQIKCGGIKSTSQFILIPTGIGWLPGDLVTLIVWSDPESRHTGVHCSNRFFDPPRKIHAAMLQVPKKRKQMSRCLFGGFSRDFGLEGVLSSRSR